VGDGVLVAERLDKSFGGRRVLRDVSVSIASGEVVGLLGPNGAGKTTTFYIIVGLLRPDRGQVSLDGKDLTDLPMYQRARAGISYLPQEASVFRKLTVEENILAILETLPILPKSVRYGSAGYSRSSASRTWPRAKRTRCPGASGAVWRSRARS